MPVRIMGNIARAVTAIIGMCRPSIWSEAVSGAILSEIMGIDAAAPIIPSKLNKFEPTTVPIEIPDWP